MKIRPIVVTVVGVALVFCVSREALAHAIVAESQCGTTIQGIPVRGVLQIERWDYLGTHRIYGRFNAPAGTLIELEVFTNQPGGVGGLWFNHAKHRETHIQLQLVNNGFLVRTEDGAAARFACQ